MKYIQQLLEVSKEDLPEIYCDMDQVLCNFMKGADKAVKEECGCDKEDDGSEKALAKKATKVKRVKYQDGVTESLEILRANIDELKSRYL